MLVTLGTNQAIAANSSHTYTYSPQSLQKIFLKFDDDAVTSTTTRVTVQVGSKTICNGASIYGLFGLTALQSGYTHSNQDFRIVLNFGSHQLLRNENLYVTVDSVVAQNAVDCSAIVDVPGYYNPLKLTEYSDNTFTSEYVYSAISYNNGGSVVDEDNYVCEIRTSTESSAPNFISANNWYSMNTVGDTVSSEFGLLLDKKIPETTSFNYSSSATTDRILAVQAMPKTIQGRRKALLSTKTALNNIPQQVL